ncbi:hypothetical protein NicSoilC5_08590 [Arthrobacter sp. NicSoilC5]|nr:hypothetical protein NicSoilC5_08590 [Arthrobacter sp. NicSoilC5]
MTAATNPPATTHNSATAPKATAPFIVPPGITRDESLMRSKLLHCFKGHGAGYSINE